MSPSNENPIKGYEFMRAKAQSQQEFSLQDLATHGNWKLSSVQAYKSKQWKGYLIPVKGPKKGPLKFTVRREFLRVSINEFLAVFTQKRLVFPSYQRAKHEVVLQFEFLLPLTKEEQLRKALDELFYIDTLKVRIDEIGLTNLQKILPRERGTTDSDYIATLIKTVGNYFGGYSVSHVQGRFRAMDLAKKASATAANRYLIDETTAVVRFIAPCNTSKIEFEDDFKSISDALDETELPPTGSHDESAQEIVLIRRLFFFFFVETVVRTIKGEDEIWLLETGRSRKLYRWSKA